MTEFLHKRSDVTLHQWASTDVVCGNQTRPVKEYQSISRIALLLLLLLLLLSINFRVTILS